MRFVVLKMLPTGFWIVHLSTDNEFVAASIGRSLVMMGAPTVVVDVLQEKAFKVSPSET